MWDFISLIAVQLLRGVWLFATPWTAVCQASLSFTISQSLLKLMSIESVMISNHFILCHPLLLLPSIFPSIRVFSNESALHIRWQGIGASAVASVLPMNIQGWFPLGLTGLILLTWPWVKPGSQTLEAQSLKPLSHWASPITLLFYFHCMYCFPTLHILLLCLLLIVYLFLLEQQLSEKLSGLKPFGNMIHPQWPDHTWHATDAQQVHDLPR